MMSKKYIINEVIVKLPIILENGNKMVCPLLTFVNDEFSLIRGFF